MTKPTKKEIEKIDRLNYFQLIRNRATLLGSREELLAELLDKESGIILGDKINELIEAVNLFSKTKK